MIYDVRQTTTYVYETAVTRARHVLRLLPVARDRQHVTAAMLDIDPVPARRRLSDERANAGEDVAGAPPIPDDPPESLLDRIDEILEQDLNAIRLRRA